MPLLWLTKVPLNFSLGRLVCRLLQVRVLYCIDLISCPNSSSQVDFSSEVFWSVECPSNELNYIITYSNFSLILQTLCPSP